MAQARAPRATAYQHNRTGEDNADAHLKRQVMGREVVVAVTGGKLDFDRGSRSSTASLTADARNALDQDHRE